VRVDEGELLRPDGAAYRMRKSEQEERDQNNAPGPLANSTDHATRTGKLLQEIGAVPKAPDWHPIQEIVPRGSGHMRGQYSDLHSARDQPSGKFVHEGR